MFSMLFAIINSAMIPSVQSTDLIDSQSPVTILAPMQPGFRECYYETVAVLINSLPCSTDMKGDFLMRFISTKLTDSELFALLGTEYSSYSFGPRVLGCYIYRHYGIAVTISQGRVFSFERTNKK